MDTHALERTSPKGGPFIGRCTKCGKTGLPMTAVHEECPNPSGVTEDQALLDAIEGEAKPASVATPSLNQEVSASVRFAGATARPWCLDEEFRANVYSTDDTGSIVATCKGFEYAPRAAAEQEANAALIVTSVNAHDELIEALAELLREAKRAWILAGDGKALRQAEDLLNRLNEGK